jgi:hypothetical protein
LPMRPSPHQLHAGPFHPVHACTAQQHTSSHTVRCARLVHLWSNITYQILKPRIKIVMAIKNIIINIWNVTTGDIKFYSLQKGSRRTDVCSHKSIPLTVECPYRGKTFLNGEHRQWMSCQWLNANRTKGDDSKTNYHIYIRLA